MIKELFLKKGAKDDKNLDEYLKLVTTVSNEKYVERHHACPKCIWPEYSDFRKFKWNKSILSIKDHLKAHFLLVKIFPKEQKLWYAVNMMVKINKNTLELSAEQIMLYERARIEFRTNIKNQIGGDKNFFRNNPEKSPWYGTNGWENPRCVDINMWASAKNLQNAMTSFPQENYNFFNRAFGFKSCCFHLYNALKDETFNWNDWDKWDKSSLNPYIIKTNIETVGEARARKLWENGRANIDIWLDAQNIYEKWFNWPVRRGNLRYGLWKSLNLTESSTTALKKAFENGWIPNDDPDWVEWRRSTQSGDF